MSGCLTAADFLARAVVSGMAALCIGGSCKAKGEQGEEGEVVRHGSGFGSSLRWLLRMASWVCKQRKEVSGD